MKFLAHHRDAIASETRRHRLIRDHGLQVLDGKLLTWHSESEYHPRMWSVSRKWVNISFILAAEAQTAALSSAGTVAADAALKEFHISKTLAYFIFTTIAIIAEALSSLVTPAISETFGRKPQYFLGAAFSCVGNGLAAVPHPAAVAVGRFMSGFAGGIPPSVSPGAIEDIIEDPRTITRCLFAWSTASNIGLAGGPIISSLLTEKLGWQATFYAGAISSFALTVFALFFQESRPSTVLQRQLRLVQQCTEDDDYYIDHPDQVLSWHSFVQETLTRPSRLFFTEPIVFMISMLDSIAYSLIYGLTGALAIVYSQFGFSAVESNLGFVPILIGTFLTIFCRIWDEHKLDKMRRNRLPIVPEDKLDSFSLSAPLLAAGLWLFAWTIPRAVQVHWAVSMIGLITVGFAANDFTTILSGYLVEAYGPYASSSFAAVGWTRSLASAALTLAISPMFENLGNNLAGSIFAIIATLFCASPFILKKYGKTLRANSPFAKYSARIAEETKLGYTSSMASETSNVSTIQKTVREANNELQIS